MDPEENRPMSKSRILLNLTVLSVSLFVYFLGFMALSNLQSTINSEKGLGTNSQAAIYAASMISCILLPELMIKSMGCKKTLVLAIMGSIPYIFANFYPCWHTLIPTAVLLGLSSGPLTASQSIYINEMARRYHKYSMSENFEVVAARFFGVFFFFSENTQIWGNLISYYLLQPPAVLNKERTLKHCGVYFVNGSNATNSNLVPPSDSERCLLVGIFVLCGVVSVLMVTFFMDSLGNDIQLNPVKSKYLSVIWRLASAARQALRIDQIMLVPISVFCGLQMGFYTSDFTQAYIACSWGVHHVGFVTICFGVCGALMAIFVGPLVKCVSQMSVIILAAIINIITCVLLFFWQPSPDVPTAYFAFAGVWGMTDSIWWSQVAALYGLMFPDDREAAFSNFFFWSFLGYFLSYSYANYFTVAVKIYIMMAFLIVGITLYIIGQVKIKCFSSRSSYVAIVDAE